MSHSAHILTSSPWPLLTSSIAWNFIVSIIAIFHKYSGAKFSFLTGLLGLLLIISLWWRDVTREGTYQGFHSKLVIAGLSLGIILFIVSEVILFFGFFFAYFNASLTPTLEIGNSWPPTGISPLNPFEVPLVNTFLLLSSGITGTWAHHALVAGNKKEANYGLILTLILGFFFTYLQYLEYCETSFSIADSVYGSLFFVTTGFHGIHVLVGAIFLTVGFIRLIKGHFSQNHHLGFEFAIWYWHFVDIVWLFLFAWIYCWGS